MNHRRIRVHRRSASNAFASTTDAGVTSTLNPDDSHASPSDSSKPVSTGSSPSSTRTSPSQEFSETFSKSSSPHTAASPTSSSLSSSALSDQSTISIPLSNTADMSTIFASTTTITLSSALRPSGTHRAPSASATSHSAPLTLTSRDGLIILLLSILAGVLSFVFAFILWRRWKRREQPEPLENIVDAVSFHQSGTTLSRRTASGYTESFTCVSCQSPVSTSPSDIKGKLRERRDSPGRWSSRDTMSIRSPPITPVQNLSGNSPVREMFDARWPGRLVPLNPSQRISAPTMDSSHVLIVAGGSSLQSDHSDAASGTRTPTETVSRRQRERSDRGAVSVMFADGTTRKNGSENAREERRRRETAQLDRGIWDGPPSEESERGSMKTGPPAYSIASDSMESVPPLPSLPLPTRDSFPLSPIVFRRGLR